MLHIINQYKELISRFISMHFSEANNSSFSFNDKLSNSLEDKNLSLDEAKDLLSRLNKGEKFKYTFKDAKILSNDLGIAGTDTWINKKSFIDNLNKIIKKSEIEKSEITISTKKSTQDVKKDVISKNFSDKNTFLNIVKTTGGIEKANKGQIMAIQSFLIGVGYNLGTFGKNKDGIDGYKGNKNSLTMRAYTDYMNKIKNNNNNLTHSQNEIIYGTEAEKVVDELTITKKYIDAFNKTYGGKGDIISRDNGIIVQLSRLFKLQDSNIDRLYNKLEGDKDFKTTLEHLKGNLNKSKLATELGLKENSEKFDSGVKRTLIIALISLVISGGSTLALEIGAINFGSNLQKGPKIQKILESLGIKVDFKEDYRNMLLSKKTTKEGVEAILDILNDENMDTANLKRFMDEVYQPNWFQDTFGIFMPDGYSKVEELIGIFNKTGKTEDAKNAVKEIYKVAYVAVEKAKKDFENAESIYNNIPDNIKKEASDSSSILKSYNDNDYKDQVENAGFDIRRYDSAKEELKLAKQGLSHLGNVTGRYTNLDAKYDRIIGEKFDSKKARKREHQIDKVLGQDNLKKIGTKELNSTQSFFKSIDREKLSDKKYMLGLLTQMREETINNETSVLSGLIRGIEQHYGISFSPKEFETAFVNTAKKVDKKDVGILSNLGREKNQRFQGNIGKGELFKININGTDVYFKDKCTNIVTVVNNIITTIDSTYSIPLVVPINTGLYKDKVDYYNNESGHNSSTPGVEGGGDNGGGGIGGGNLEGRI